jgi:glycosyltransferase involved in cell wall biosynthesis
MPGIWVTGTVDDVRRFVQPAAVYVVPLRVGGGSRLKILEAMAMGRPVVSTTIGAEGIDVVDGRHVALADDPTAFAAAVLALLDDAARGDAMAREGRALVEARYGWDALAMRFGAAIRGAARRQPALRLVSGPATSRAR